MTYQRKRRGVDAVFYPIIKRTDGRGNERKLHDPDNPLPAKVWIFPQRGAKAEVTGQQTINVVRIGTTADLPGVALGSRVEFQGKAWDVVSPPQVRAGVRRHTRHMSMDVRERP
jgi:hypothetical protein